MNKYMSKRGYIIINIGLFLIEIILVYLLINSYLHKDYISPNDITFYEYLMNKFTNLA